MREKKLIITLEILPVGSLISKPVMEEGGFTSYELHEPYLQVSSNKHPCQHHLVPLEELRELLTQSAHNGDIDKRWCIIENTLEPAEASCEKSITATVNIL